MRLTQLVCALSVKAAEKFARYATFSPTPLSLKQLSAFGQSFPSESQIFYKKFIFCRRSSSRHHRRLWYEESFSELADFESVELTTKNCDDYLKFLEKTLRRHANVVETMACGVMEMRETHGSDTALENQMQYFLDRFHTMRISIRMLISQHLLVFGSESEQPKRFVGCIDQHCDVVEILKDAYSDAKLLCDHYYADSPEMRITLSNAVDGSIKFVYVPSHLYHILFELLKNAMRAVVERGRNPEDDEFPPIDVLVVDGKHNVTIKISDKGGGFPRSFADLLFRYTFTTAHGSKGKPADVGKTGNAPMAGYGYGLPLSRLYARYLHGDLMVAGLEGYGTDAFVFLMRRDSEADELLPVFNRTSARRYEPARTPVADWAERRSALEKP
ncbi:hypothetical protein AAHC03_09535 [Spirometra sp. Aus1]